MGSPLPSPGNILRVRHKWSIDTPPFAYTRIFYEWSGAAPTTGACAAIAAEHMANFVTYGKALLSSDWVLEEVDVTDLSSSSGAEGVDTSSTTGSRGGSPALGQAPVHVQFNISRRYRGGKPGVYLPLGTSSDYSGVYQWTSEFLSSVDTDVADWFNGLNGYASGGCTVGEQVNVSWYEGNEVVVNPITGRARNVPKPRAAPVVDIIGNWTAGQRIASQRRRRGKS
jgi:hypothetical protein